MLMKRVYFSLTWLRALVINAVYIDLPRIELVNTKCGAGSVKAGRDRVILIVVLEHSGAANREKIFKLIKIFLDDVDISLITGLNNWICLFRANDKRATEPAFGNSHPPELVDGQVEKLSIIAVP